MITVQQVAIRTLADAIAEIMKIGAAPGSIGIVPQRAVFKCLRVWNAGPRIAIALKDGMLAAGGEASLSAGADQGAPSADMLLFGTLEAFRGMLAHVPENDAEFRACAHAIKQALMNSEGTVAPPPTAWGAHSLNWGARTFIMGILNVTGDSFYAGSRKPGLAHAVPAAAEMIAAGADIIDVGGESSRPGADPVSAKDELARVAPVITEIRKQFPQIIISIDTYKATVAAAALESGADIINDISALGADPDMARVAAEAGAPVCLMHMQGEPRNMQANPSYPRDVCGEIISFLERRIDFALEAGILENRIVVDPGIGFGKTAGHNLEIMNRLEEFLSLGRPLLVGASRKSFIGKALALPESGRLEGSLAAAALAVAGGADILRVHDVPETLRAARMADAIVRRKRRPPAHSA